MGRTRLACAMLLVAALTAPSYGWVITQTAPGHGLGEAESVVVPIITHSNYDAFEIHKYFMQDNYPITLKFVKQANDQNTINIVDESILNMMTQSATIWAGYHVQVNYDPVTPNDRVWFKTTDPEFAPLAWKSSGGPQRLGWTPSSYDTDINGKVISMNWQTSDPSQEVPYGQIWDAPYNQLLLGGIVIDVSQVKVGDAFYLTQWASVPEPATIALLSAGIMGIVLRRRRKS